MNPLSRCTAAILAAGLASAAGCATPRADTVALTAFMRKDQAAVERATLPNGMPLLIKPDRSAPVVSIQFWIGSGSMHEETYLGAGIAHAVEHMIFKGTGTRAPGAITREINDAGGQVNAYTTLDRTVVFADLPANRWETGLDVLADAVTDARFPEEEWTLEREVILREFAMGDDDPDRVLGRQLWQTAFRTDPRRHPVIGYADAFRTLTRDDLAAWHRRHYTPCNMMLVVVGDVDPDAVRAYAAERLAGFSRAPRAPVILPPEPPQTAPREERITHPAQLSRLAMAWPTVAVHHPDAIALDLLARIAGQGRASRLHRALVEEQGILHQVSAWSYTPARPGLFGLHAVFDPSREAEVITAINHEIERLRADPVTAAEWNRAVRATLTEQLGALETMRGQASQYGLDMHATGDPGFSLAYLERLDTITPEALTRVARRYLDPRTISRVMLAPTGTEAGEARPAPPPETAPEAISRHTLSNGATLLTLERRRLPFVYAAVALQGGVRSEPEPRRGLTLLMAHLLMRGAGGRDREAIADAIESRGASLTPYAGHNAFGLTARCLRDDAGAILDLLADCLLDPSFPPDEINRQRDLQAAAIRRWEENPMDLAVRQLREHLFAAHPYHDEPEGRLETLAAISREDLLAHHRRLTVSRNLVIALFGDLSDVEARDWAERAFKRLREGPAPDISPPSAAPALPARTSRESPHAQAIVMTGFPGITVADPQRDALDLLQTAMSGLSSELALEIRDRRGLAYFTGAMQQTGLDPGMFAVYAGTRPDAVDDVERLMRVELERLAGQGLRDDELERAKAQWMAAHDRRLQNPRIIAQECALQACYGLDAQAVLTRPARIAAVTAEDIVAVARRILDARRQAISIILPDGE